MEPTHPPCSIDFVRPVFGYAARTLRGGNGKAVTAAGGTWHEWNAMGMPPSRLPVSLRMVLTRSEEHTSELQSLMRISYAVFCLKKKKTVNQTPHRAPPDSLPHTSHVD